MPVKCKQAILTDCLLGLHVFSECSFADKGSSFADKGKLSALKKQQHFQDTCREFGESWIVIEALRHWLEDYVCSRYNCSGNRAGVVNKA